MQILGMDYTTGTLLNYIKHDLFHIFSVMKFMSYEIQTLKHFLKRPAESRKTCAQRGRQQISGRVFKK
jgi:hypothetical protein